MINSRVSLLVKILLDKTARIDERDDAAMDLYEFDDDIALEALLKIAQDLDEEKFIQDACGESIAEIWIRRNIFDIKAFKHLTPEAYHAAYTHIAAHQPKWLQNLPPHL